MGFPTSSAVMPSRYCFITAASTFPQSMQSEKRLDGKRLLLPNKDKSRPAKLDVAAQ